MQVLRCIHRLCVPGEQGRTVFGQTTKGVIVRSGGFVREVIWYTGTNSMPRMKMAMQV